MLSKLRRARSDLATMNRLLPRAERIAHDDAAELPGVEHLLLAALELEDTTAADVLTELGVTANDLRAAISQQHAEALLAIGIATDVSAIDPALPSPGSAPRVYQSKGSLQDALRRAFTLARKDGSELRSAHILLAATEAQHGTLARALRRLGVDPDQLRTLARRRLDRTSGPA